jgi:hypothetical protein
MSYFKRPELRWNLRQRTGDYDKETMTLRFRKSASGKSWFSIRDAFLRESTRNAWLLKHSQRSYV